MSGRRATPRRRTGTEHGRAVFALVCVVLILLVGVWAWWSYTEGGLVEEPAQEDEPSLPVHKVTHDSMAVTYTYNGEMIRWYVLIDPDNGVQYIVNDRGGCCPRVSYDGSIMGVWGEDAS